MQQPSFSCPMIDDALSQIDSAIQIMKDIKKEVDLPDRFDPSDEITGLELAEANLEGVRSINSKLRKYANHREWERDFWKNEHKQLQARLEAKEKDLNEIQFRIAAKVLAG